MSHQINSVACLLLLIATLLTTEEIARANDKTPVNYTKQVKPLLTRRCVVCHGPLKQEGGLRVDAGVLIRKGGETGPAIIAGKPAESILIDAITKAENASAMPKTGGALKKEEIELLRRWIAEGANSPENEDIAADPRQHWSFVAPQQADLPKPQNGVWRQHPVDAFLAVEHERRGLTPQQTAPKHILLRRVTLDLTGLPPTPEELSAFLADDSPTSYEKVVDRLLDSPRYGERWGRHWMDIWRYSDWYGYRAELRNSAKHIWHWRDWIIESLNNDTPYDAMVRDMLAADELAPTDPNRLRATGFLARNYYKFNRNTWLDATIEHTGKAFVGLRLNCARCHDHMYDPISQAEYYKFRAIFEPYQVRTDRIPGESDINKDGLPRIYDADVKKQTYVFLRGNDKYPDKENPVTAAVPALLETVPFDIDSITLPTTAWYPGGQEFIYEESIAAAEATLKQQQSAHRKASRAVEAITAVVSSDSEGLKRARAKLSLVEKQLTAADAARAAVTARVAADKASLITPPADNSNELATAAAKAEKIAAIKNAESAVAVAKRALDEAKQAAAQDAKQKPKVPAAQKKLSAATKQLSAATKAAKKPGNKYTKFSATYPRSSSGRRAALANWITHSKNPLTARVAVNHIWMRHFGSPLVSTVFDFGLNGKPPSHPKLLDWLAVDFQKSGWRMKHLHRLLVTSQAYRMHSATAGTTEENLNSDPDNLYLWRMNARRMESELVRDSILSVTAQLDLKMGGPELDANQGQSTYRRSLYYRHAPEKFMTFLTLFDSASATDCYRRNETVVPQQALALVNSRLSVEQARRLAADLTKAAADDDQFIETLFTRLLCRPPTKDERTTCRAFLTAQSKKLADTKSLTQFTTGAKPTLPAATDPKQRARENLTQVLLNHNEFITIR